MKLRLTDRSIRLRLDPDDVDRLVRDGVAGHRVQLAAGQSLAFAVTASPTTAAVRAEFDGRQLRVDVPAAAARRWAASADEVSIRGEQPVPGGRPLAILVEKDFECLHGEQEGPAFPHPGRDPV